MLQIDGVDGTFTRADELPNKKGQDEVVADPNESENATQKLPLKKTDFSIIGKKSQLQVAMALTDHLPDIDDYDNFPLPSSKQIAAEKARVEREAKEAEEEVRKQEDLKLKEAAALLDAAKPKKKSLTKVEQVSPITSEVVRVSYFNACNCILRTHHFFNMHCVLCL